MHNLVAFGGRKWSGKNTCADVLIAQGYIPVSFAAPVKDVVAYVYDVPRDRLEGLTEEDRVWRETPHPHMRAGEHVKAWKHSHRLEWTISFVYDLQLMKPRTVEESAVYIQKPHPHIGGKSPREAFTYVRKRVAEIQDDWTPVHAMQYVGTEIFRGLYPNTWTEKFKRSVEPGLGLGQRYAVTDLRFENEAIAIKELGGVIGYIDRPDVRDERYASHASEQTELIRPYADFFLLNGGSVSDLQAKVQAHFGMPLAA